MRKVLGANYLWTCSWHSVQVCVWHTVSRHRPRKGTFFQWTLYFYTHIVCESHTTSRLKRYYLKGDLTALWVDWQSGFRHTGTALYRHPVKSAGVRLKSFYPKHVRTSWKTREHGWLWGFPASPLSRLCSLHDHWRHPSKAERSHWIGGAVVSSWLKWN